MERELVVFSEDASQYGSTVIPAAFYLTGEDEWINVVLRRSPHLDGIALLIDWDKKTIICKRKPLA